MARTPQDPNEQLPTLDIIEVGGAVVPPTPTPTTNKRVQAVEGFVPKLKEYHGEFVKVLAGQDITEVGKWQRAGVRVPFVTVSTRRAHGSGDPRKRDLWMKYDEGE